MHSLRDERDDILWMNCFFDIDEEGQPAVVLQTPANSRAKLVLPMRRWPVNST